VSKTPRGPLSRPRCPRLDSCEGDACWEISVTKTASLLQAWTTEGFHKYGPCAVSGSAAPGGARQEPRSARGRGRRGPSQGLPGRRDGPVRPSRAVCGGPYSLSRTVQALEGSCQTPSHSCVRLGVFFQPVCKRAVFGLSEGTIERGRQEEPLERDY